MRVELSAKTVPTIEGLDTQNFAAYVARIGKVKDNPIRLLKYLIKNSHWSPFEHTFFTFKIETSRAIGRQLLRHRSFTFQEWSQRYEQEIIGFEPIEIRKKAEKNRQSSEEQFNPILSDELVPYVLCEYLENDMRATTLIDAYLTLGQDLYNALIESGVASECARMILPETTKTTILMTGSIRSWIHFITLRLDEHAQKEAQQIGQEINNILMQEIPVVFEAIK